MFKQEDEAFVSEILLDKRKKINRKFKNDNLVRTADLRETFSKRDTTNWSFKLHEITSSIKDTKPSNLLDDLPERYYQSLLKKNYQ